MLVIALENIDLKLIRNQDRGYAFLCVLSNTGVICNDIMYCVVGTAYPALLIISIASY